MLPYNRCNTVFNKRFAVEAKESAASKQQQNNTTQPIVIDGQTVDYAELKRRYNTLNEIELRELIEKLQQDEKDKEAGKGGVGGETRPAFDRTLKPGAPKLQNKYNLRTVGIII